MSYEHFKFSEILEQKQKALMTKIFRILISETSNYPLRIPLFSGVLTSMMCWLRISFQIVSTAFRSKVMVDWSLKFGQIKADIILVNWSEKIVDKNTLLWWRIFSHMKNMILGSQISKILKSQKWAQKSSWSSY